jgi:hypothetical protein
MVVICDPHGKGSLEFFASLLIGMLPVKVTNWLCVLLVSLSLAVAVTAQTAKQSPPKSALCSQDIALQMIAQQIAAAKTLDNSVQKITVMLRGAELLWPYQRERSRAAFVDAFELAKQNYKAEGDAPKRAGKGLLVGTPDQRFVVIKAIAKRDPSWARKLTEELLSDETGPSKNAPFSEEPSM